MTNTNKIILDLINKNASVNEITSITGLTHKQLFYRMNMLKIKGYDFSKKYYYNGDIVYQLNKVINKQVENEETIITSNKDTEFKAILISDLHLGNISERPELLYEVYNYCVKNGINIIINAGDLVDGTAIGHKTLKTIPDIEKQIEFLLKNYPFDKNILNFICLGNHDLSCLNEIGLNISNVFDNKRHDLISLGFGYGYINVKNDKIIVTHPKAISNLVQLNYDKKVHLKGHSHKYQTSLDLSKHSFNFSIPSLSDSRYNSKDMLPSMLQLNILFKNGYFQEGILEHLIFVDNKIYNVSTSLYDLSKGKNFNEKIKNEEEKASLSDEDIKKIVNVKEETKVKKLDRKVTSGMSQIEKFNARYNR